jgi:Ca-activated chloride channel family protein
MLLRLFLALSLVFQFTLSVDVDLVVFNVSVLDNDGRPVTALTADNFRVYEDGREEKIKLFQPEDTPATVGLVIDNSGSMVNKQKDVVNAAGAFVAASHDEDEMFIVNFNGKASLGLPESLAFTTDRSQLRATLAQTRAEGTTALYDALKLSLDHLKEGTRQRKALVLLSDGGDNASLANLNDVLRLAQQSSATVYCIGIYDPNQKDRNPSVLKRIAKVTGGETYFPSAPGGMQTVWPHIANAIRGQYTIGYHSSNASHEGGYRTVKITATTQKGKKLDVRTRPGYLGGSR